MANTFCGYNAKAPGVGQPYAGPCWAAVCSGRALFVGTKVESRRGPALLLGDLYFDRFVGTVEERLELVTVVRVEQSSGSDGTSQVGDCGVSAGNSDRLCH